MPKFRKKPVVIEAIQWTGTNRVECAQFVRGSQLSIDDELLFPGDHMRRHGERRPLPRPQAHGWGRVRWAQ